MTSMGLAISGLVLASASFALGQAKAAPAKKANPDMVTGPLLRMDLLGRLAERGTPVINSPRALETAIDKYLSLARLAAGADLAYIGTRFLATPEASVPERYVPFIQPHARIVLDVV